MKRSIKTVPSMFKSAAKLESQPGKVVLVVMYVMTLDLISNNDLVTTIIVI